MATVRPSIPAYLAETLFLLRGSLWKLNLTRGFIYTGTTGRTYHAARKEHVLFDAPLRPVDIESREWVELYVFQRNECSHVCCANGTCQKGLKVKHDSRARRQNALRTRFSWGRVKISKKRLLLR